MPASNGSQAFKPASSQLYPPTREQHFKSPSQCKPCVSESHRVCLVLLQSAAPHETAPAAPWDSRSSLIISPAKASTMENVKNMEQDRLVCVHAGSSDKVIKALLMSGVQPRTRATLSDNRCNEVAGCCVPKLRQHAVERDGAVCIYLRCLDHQTGYRITAVFVGHSRYEQAKCHTVWLN